MSQQPQSKGMSAKQSSKQFPTLKMRRVASSSLRFGSNDVDVNDFEDVHAETDGKSPIEAALIVMRKITRAAGADTVTRGISSLDKLQSLPTEAASKLLGKTDWRKFFDDEEKFVRDQQVDAAKFPNKHQDHPHKHTHLHLKAKMNEYFEEMITRVDTHWKLVKIPHRDMEFYQGTLMQGPPKSLEHCRELANYIKMLHLNRLSVLSVLKTIEARESALSNLHDVLASIARQRTLLPSRSGGAILGLGDRPSSQSPHSVPYSQFPSHSYHSDGKGREGSRSEFWLLQLVIAVSDLQVTTFAVVKAVQHWRRDLWRPQPFVWKHVNYLLKMKSDEESYDTLMLRQMLDQVPLSPSELPCVFMGIASGPYMAHQASAFSFDTHHGATANSNESPSGLRLKFFASQPTDVCLEDMLCAAGRINDEAELQKYVRKERLLLKKRGAFIPALRPRPNTGPGSGPDQYNFHDRDHGDGHDHGLGSAPHGHGRSFHPPHANRQQDQAHEPFDASCGAQRQDQQPLQTESFHWEWKGEAGWDREGGEGVGVGAIVPPHLLDGAPHNDDDLMSAPGVQSYVFEDPPLGLGDPLDGNGTARAGSGSVKSHQSQNHRHRQVNEEAIGRNATTTTTTTNRSSSSSSSSSRDGINARRGGRGGGQGGGGEARAGPSSAGSASMSVSLEGRQGARQKLEPLVVRSVSRGEGSGVPNNSTQLTVSSSSSSKKYSSHAESSASGVSAAGSKSQVDKQQKRRKQGEGREEANELSDGPSLSLYSADFHHSTSLSDHAAMGIKGGHRRHQQQQHRSVDDSEGDGGGEGYDVDFEAADDGSIEGTGGYEDGEEEEEDQDYDLGGVGNYDDDDFEATHSSHHAGGYEEDDVDEHDQVFDGGTASSPSPSPHHRSRMGSSGEIEGDIE